MARNALSGVKCKVENCKFWSQGYKCTADAIEVNADGGHGANQSSETNCHTFAPAK